MNTEGNAPEGARQQTKLLLVDEHPLIRAGVRTLLEQQPGMLVAEAESIQDAVDYCKGNQPDVVLMNLNESTADAVLAVQRLQRACVNSAVVILGRRGDDEELFRAVVAGAAGHVGESAQPHELITTIEEAADGAEPIGQSLARRPEVGRRVLETFLEMHRRSEAESDEIVTLSERELVILRHAAEGLTNRKIGYAMGLSEHTVKSEFSKILSRLGMRHRTEAVVRAVREGWISVPIEPETTAQQLPVMSPVPAATTGEATEATEATAMADAAEATEAVPAASRRSDRSRSL
jgi:two-component system NarL family response regulator